MSAETTPPTENRLEIIIRHAIPTDCDCTVPGDTFLTGFGVCCPDFKFWYCATAPLYQAQNSETPQN